MQWQREQVLALAPDQASIKAAQSLVNTAKWPMLGRDPIAIWGECRGSGKTPYRTAIDLRELAFKCSCPSRKFPCKHALALFLLAVDADAKQGDIFFSPPISAPEWVQTWLDGRTKRGEAKKAKANTEQDGSPEDTADAKREEHLQTDATPTPQQKAAQQRADARVAKVAVGIDELTIWLKDLVRAGFAEAQAQPHRYWQQMAARLIDAQAPGLATQVQTLGSIVLSGAGWAERFMAALGRLFLLLEAYQRIDDLPPALQQDIRSLIGWHQTKETVLAQPPVQGYWQVLSNKLEQDETLLTQRIWLRETTHNTYALILNFAPITQRQSLDLRWHAGMIFDATLYFYESATPLRAVIGESATPLRAVIGENATPLRAVIGETTVTDGATAAPPLSIEGPKQGNIGGAIADVFSHYQEELSRNPWLTRYPLTVANAAVCLAPQSDRAVQTGQNYLYDMECHTLPLHRQSRNQWQILSITGGQPAQIFGEWWDDGFLPLGLWHEGAYWAL